MMMFKSFTLDGLCEKLCEPKSTLIVYHVRSDADAVGSAFALRELLRLMGSNAICACADEVPARLRFLSEDSQGSVVIEDGIPLGHERAISVDSASPSQLGSLFELLHKDIDIMIDHHASGTVYADNYIDPTASATGEIIYALAKRLLELGEIELIPPRVISCIYAAISSDTGGFRFANVTPRTHRIAAELIELGVDAADINHRLFESKTEAQLRAEAEATRRMKVYADGRIASTTVPRASCVEHSLDEESLETVIDIPRSVAGVDVAFAVRQIENSYNYRVSMRSAIDFDVSAVCARFGGGGHKRAAGCTVTAANIDEAEAMIAKEVRARLKEYLNS